MTSLIIEWKGTGARIFEHCLLTTHALSHNILVYRSSAFRNQWEEEKGGAPSTLKAQVWLQWSINTILVVLPVTNNIATPGIALHTSEKVFLSNREIILICLDLVHFLARWALAPGLTQEQCLRSSRSWPALFLGPPHPLTRAGRHTASAAEVY